MLFISTGLAMAQIAPMPALLNGGAIMVYSGAQPANADAAPTGTLLAIVSNNGFGWTPGSPTNGLNIVTTSGRYLAPDPAQTWKMVATVTGTAGWGRFVGPTDTLASTLTFPRIDFAVNGSDGMGLVLANPSVTVGDIRVIDYWSFGIPPL